MLDSKNNTPDPTDEQMDEQLKRLLADEAPAEIHERCSTRFDAFEETLLREARAPRSRPRLALFFLRPAWAGGGVAFTAVLVVIVALLFSHSRVSWADVVNTFNSVRFFSATIFVTENPLKSPEKMELWRAHDGRTRIHYQRLVLFGQKGELSQAFSLELGKEIDVARLSREEREKLGIEKPLGMLKMLGPMPELSLNSILDIVCGRKLVSPPIANAQASVSSDMQVFDVTNDQSPQWMRIWALRSSRLPVRLRHWDPTDGDSIEVLFDYMQEQPAEAFDPAAFKRALSDTPGGSNRAYALLQDPGGRQLTPSDLFKVSGYCMPKIARAGCTADGLFWVESTNSTNRTPEGRTFHGFGRLQDNLGQEYLRCLVGNKTQGDLTLEYFIPLGYGTDYRKPGSYQLTCWSQPDHPSQPAETVGSISVKTWQEGAPVPALFGDDAFVSAFEVRKALIREYRLREDWEHFDKLLEQIPGEPESDPQALYREQQRLAKLESFGRFEEVLALAQRLYPLLRKQVAQTPYEVSGVVRSYVLGLIRQEKTSEAGQLVREHLEDLKQLPENTQSFEHFAAQLYMDLHDRIGWPAARITALFPEGVLDLPKVREQLQMFGIGTPGQGRSLKEIEQSSETEPWRKYLSSLAESYKASRPLPESMEFLTGEAAFSGPGQSLLMDLPGHADYQVFKMPPTWEEVLSSMAWAKGWDPRLIQVDGSLKQQKIQAVCVMKKEFKPEDAYEVYMGLSEVETVEKPLERRVWVARYDGRKLPNWREVRPLEWKDAPGQPVIRAGGSNTTAHVLLEAFMDATNGTRQGLRAPLADEMVYIVDETGLPQRPGVNQSSGSICLCYEYQFWQGKQAAERARTWFQENFGISFHEEKRVLKFRQICRH